MNEFFRETVRLLACGLVGVLAGLALQQPVAGFALGVVCYSVWQAGQLTALSRWLSGDKQEMPPEGRGSWAQIFDKLYQLEKAYQAEHEQLLSAVNYMSEGVASLSDGVIMVDEHGVIVWCNNSTEQMVGVRSPQDKGNLLVNLLRDPDFVRYFQRGVFDAGLEMQSPDNSGRLLRVEVTLFGVGNRLVFIRDVTKIRKLEQMRVDFIANVSHELRTPLTVINGYLETLRGEGEDIPPAALQRALGQMQSQSERMLTLVNDITLLSRLESEPDSGKTGGIDVAALATMLVDDAKCSIGAERRFHLQLDRAHGLRGEETAIHSALGNLVDNACKYSNPGDEITIRWYIDQQAGIFEVVDNGVGVDATDIPRLTERFYRADKSRSAASGGTGLGLAIVKHALLRHGAHLEIQSQLGKGSVFRCVFPRYRVTGMDALPAEH